MTFACLSVSSVLRFYFSELECPEICTFIYLPVCGSDGVTYGNKCQFDAAKCKNSSLEMVKEGEQGRCPVTQYRMPPIIWGLHFLEILALILLTFHTLVHGHAIFNYLKKTWLKRKQDQAEAELARKEAERLKMEKEINEQVAARLKVEKKEKVEKKFDPNIALASA